MNTRSRSLLVLLAVVVLVTAGVVWAAEQKKAEEVTTHTGTGHNPAAAPADKAQAGVQAGGMSHEMGKMDQMGMMNQMGMMKMHGLPPEKAEAIKKIVDGYQDKFFAIRQDIYAKEMEIEAVMAQAQPDMAKAKTLAKERAGLEETKINLHNEMRAQIIKETGIRLPVTPRHMGHMMMGPKAHSGGGGCKMMKMMESAPGE
ncbi:MAG: periplasmic heavy metal sensor [Deltaproteobacteria bacterium]|nr:periplasmic heavy metal sensor [Deltaproteobacteria bacterium]